MTTDTVPPLASAADTPKTPKSSRRVKLRPGAGRQMHGGPLTYAVLIFAALVSLFPLYWTVVAASTSNGRITESPPPFIPGSNLAKNLEEAWTQVHMETALLNTFIVAGTVAFATVLFATLAGFAFAKMRFKGSNLLLLLVIGTMMVPPQLGVVPLFMLMGDLGWSNELPAVIMPTLVSAFGVFFMRQYLIEALPTELIEAARVDGAHSLRIFWHVVLPAARPAMAVLGMLTFVQSWNDLFWPMIVLNADNPTVQVSLSQLGQGYVPDRSVIMAGALIGTLPLLLLFLLLGKQIVNGIMQGAVKG
ncbi:carbohydrate ABC transporter permease [Streptomyces capparidis]